MKIFLTITLLFCFCFQSFGQNDSSKGEEVFEIFDGYEVAVFKDGGEEGLYQFIAENVIYPQEAIKNNISGVVNMVFVVNSTGEVENVKIIDKKYGYGLEEEAIRVIKLTNGLWTPAVQRGKNVEDRYRILLKFNLDGKTHTKLKSKNNKI